jgi:ParB-like chromosome segregation protein Spo0J
MVGHAERSPAPKLEMLKLDRVDERYGRLRLVRPARFEQVRRSVERHGLLHPLVVNALADGTRVLLDGFKRLAALRQLAAAEAPCRVVQVAEAAAQAALITYNRPHHGLCELEQAWVVRSLVRQVGLSQTQVAELLGRHKSWACRRLALAERLSESLQEDLRLGLVPSSVARELARLPRGNQDRLGEVVRRQAVTARQAARLVDAVLHAPDRDALDAVLADPLRFLAQRPEPVGATKDPRLSGAGEAVRRSLLRLSDASLGVSRTLARCPLLSLSDLDADVLDELVRPIVVQTDEALGQARRLMRGTPS